MNYTLSKSKNEKLIRKLRTGRLEAIVCVGMLGEGLDVPELKIATLHAAPASLPFTLQLIGRVTRTTAGQRGPAQVIAIPEQVKGEVRRLYHEDADWRRLVPQLVDAIIGSSSQTAGNSPLSNILRVTGEDLRPFFSVAVYEPTTGNAVSFVNASIAANTALPSDVLHVDLVPTAVPGLRAYATVSEREPTWAQRAGLFEDVLDLHLFYICNSRKFAFVGSTCDRVGSVLHKQLLGNSLTTVASGRLAAAMKTAAPDDYVTVGLVNALGPTGALPRYKMHLGSDAGASIRPSDGRAFGAGHVFARLQGAAPTGIASKRGRVWSLKRDGVEKFAEWCEDIATKMSASGRATLPGLAFLAQPETANKIEMPIAALLPDEVCWSVASIRVEDRSGGFIPSDREPELQPRAATTGQLDLALNFHSTAAPLRMKFDISRPRPWLVDDARQARVFIDRANSAPVNEPLEHYLNEHPPTLVMRSGGVVIGREWWRPSVAAADFPSSRLVVKDWSNCDITKEAKPAPPPKLNVQDRTLELLRAEATNNVLIVLDDRANEVADYVVFDLGATPKLIRLVHCKWSSKSSPGARLDDSDELLFQCVRSRRWVYNSTLVKRLNDRLAKNNSLSKVVVGQRATLTGLERTFAANEWTYEVLAVQPGFRLGTIRKQAPTTNLKKELLATFEFLSAASTEFRVWGS